MAVTVIPIVVEALGTVLKSLRKPEIRDRIEILQVTALLKSARILRKVLDSEGNLLSLRFWWKTTSYCRCENLAKSKLITLSHNSCYICIKKPHTKCNNNYGTEVVLFLLRVEVVVVIVIEVVVAVSFVKCSHILHIRWSEEVKWNKKNEAFKQNFFVFQTKQKEFLYLKTLC